MFCINCASAGKIKVPPPDFSFLSGKWKSISIVDPKKNGPEIGRELKIRPDGRCTIVTDRFRIYTEYEVALSLKNGVIFIPSKKKEFPYFIKLDSTRTQLAITAPEIIGWIITFLKSDDSIPELHALPRLPRTVHDAVSILYSDLTEEEKNNLLVWHSWDLVGLHHGYGTWIRNRFCLWGGNEELLSSCGSPKMDPDDASGVIIHELRKEVRRRADTQLSLCLDLQDSILNETEIYSKSINDRLLPEVITIINKAFREKIYSDTLYTPIKDFQILLSLSNPKDSLFQCPFKHVFLSKRKANDKAVVETLLFEIKCRYSLEEKRDAVMIQLFESIKK
jgi:hypothetical protein